MSAQSRAIAALTGLAILALLWAGPLPEMARERFSAHMAMHMGVVAIAAPLLSLAAAGGRWDFARRAPALFNPIAASIVELLVVWGWHAPAAHHAARAGAWMLAAEQGSFLAAGLWLWLAALGGEALRGERSWSGVAALLFTSIHMTLLGAIFALAPRALYARSHGGEAGLALWDQHLGGSIMLLTGGASYLAGGLWLAAKGLRQR